MVDIATLLPDYTASNFAEILLRFDQSMYKLDQLLEKMDQLQEIADKNSQQNYTDFERDYRAAVARRYDRVNLFGADVRRNTKRYKLSVAYVSLDLSPRDEDYEDLIIETNDNDEDNLSYTRLGREVHQRIPVADALGRRSYCAIIGEAGSGKTTLLQWLAVTSATNGFDRKMAGWAESIPFLVELRRFNFGLPTIDSLVKISVPELAVVPPHNWIHETLEDGRGLLLVDGFDEVASNKREKVYDWLNAIIETYPNARVVITSRPPSFEQGYLDELGFDELFLSPMNMQEIQQFIEYWHEAVLLESEIETRESTRVIVEKLITEIKNSAPLSRLATNPLLCAMICALHYDRSMKLPSDRLALYEACCSMLLERRDLEREVDLGDYPKLTYKQKRVLLDDLSYWMLKNEYSSISNNAAVERIANRLGYMQLESPSNDAELVLSLLLERSGMLRQLSFESIDFVHKTFQEYMAACVAVSEGDWGLLVAHSNNDSWKETIILAAGMANREKADYLILGILRTADNNPSRQAFINLLAISCLETAVEISASTRIQVQDRIHLIVPPKTRDHVNSLVAAGDLAVPFLVSSITYSESQAAMCVQILGRISSQQALKALCAYLDDSRETIRVALDDALSMLTPELVEASGLSDCLLYSLDKFIDNSYLSLSGNFVRAVDPAKLSEFARNLSEGITEAELFSWDEYCMYLVPTFSKSESLALIGDPVPSDLSNLQPLSSLSSLYLNNLSENWPDIKMPHLPKLRILRLKGSGEDLPYFQKDIFTNLDELHIFFGGETEDLEMIGDFFPSVGFLNIATLTSIPDLRSLEELPMLHTLQVSVNSMNSPDFLVGVDILDNLKRIIVVADKISKEMKIMGREVEKYTGCKVEFHKNNWRNDW